MDQSYLHLDELMDEYEITADHLAAIRRLGHPLPIQNMIAARDAADWLLLLEALGICTPRRRRTSQATPTAA